VQREILPGRATSIILVCAIALAMFVGFQVQASDTRAEMQRQLNEEVMSSPFDPGDVEKAEAWAKEAMKKDLKPVKVAPEYWQPGWTCSNLMHYRYYRYRHYRDCIYYHRYYGRYW